MEKKKCNKNEKDERKKERKRETSLFGKLMKLREFLFLNWMQVIQVENKIRRYFYFYYLLDV